MLASSLVVAVILVLGFVILYVILDENHDDEYGIKR